MDAIIETLRAQTEEGEEKLLYPRSVTSAITDSEGKGLDETIEDTEKNIQDLDSRTDVVETSLEELLNGLVDIVTNDTYQEVDSMPDTENSVEVTEQTEDTNTLKELIEDISGLATDKYQEVR